MSSIQKIETTNAPQAIGPYSQAITAGEFIFCSGQIGLDPVASTLVEGGIRTEADRAILNLKNILESAGSDLAHVVRADVYLTNLDNFVIFNEIYETHFSQDPKPARATVEVSKLPKGALIEISCVAYKPQ